jgi:hypothetical protein
VSVYVDSERWPFGRMLMCHMMADTPEELHGMADKIGLKRRWAQMSRTGVLHYDICQQKRAEAVWHGVLEVDRRKVVELMRKAGAR